MDRANKPRRTNGVSWLVAMLLVASTTGMICLWLAPGLDAYARDCLMRARGPLVPPDDIAIVAIDEASVRRLGRFPWSRDLTARVLDEIALAQPKVIALDVLYSEPTTEAYDAALARAIAHTGKTVVAAQLVDLADEHGRVEWLRPLPFIEESAAGVGHAHISTESDGTARELLLRKTDDDGRALWSLAVEAVRVGDDLEPGEVRDVSGSIRLGGRTLQLASNEHRPPFSTQGKKRLVNLRADRMVIDYVGPAGSFAQHTYSFADVLEGKVGPEKFRGKYVLIGATAVTLGDAVASPFVHHEAADRSQHGKLMPGVEILANAINTILRERFYRETPDWLAAICALLTASAMMFALTLTQGRFETLKQLGAFGGLVIAVLAISYLVFKHWLIIPPLVPSLVSLFTAAPLLLLRRSLVTSANLDEQIAELSSAAERLAPLMPDVAQTAVAGELAAKSGWETSFALTGWLPKGIEWKTQALGRLHRRIVERARFIDRALRSVEDGLVVAEVDGRIFFANRRAAEIFGASEFALVGDDLFERLAGDQSDADMLKNARREMLLNLIVERLPIEREIALGNSPRRYYMVRLSAVPDGTGGAVLGIVASLSDVSKQRELQRTKTDVMTLVTHELRTPLTAIQGMSEVLAQYDVDGHRRREMHLAINEEAKRLARMINDYLDITRLESGARPLHLAPTPMAPLVERALLMLDPLAAQRGLRIVSRFAPDLPPLLADADLLTQAVTNLVANAIKYSRPSGEIRVGVRVNRETLWIEVADRGHGIPAELRSRIFEKFYRVPRPADGGVTGTGLGLAFVREIAEKHGGRVHVESEEDVGSVFTLRLPLAGPDQDVT